MHVQVSIATKKLQAEAQRMEQKHLWQYTVKHKGYRRQTRGDPIFFISGARTVELMKEEE
jgi:hypothetical protein